MFKDFKKSFSLFIFFILFVNLIFQKVVFAETVGDLGNKDIGGTSIGGSISSNMKLTLENSPYTLTKDVQIDYGVTLTIEAGVVIKGNNYNLRTGGTLSAIGTAENKITFENVNIGINWESTKPGFFDIKYAKVYGGSILKASGNGMYGSFTLSDSYIKDTKNNMYVWYPTANSFIERNIFENSCGISVGTSDGVEVAIRNNVFYKQTGDYAIENWASYDTSKTIVENNSFLSNDRVAVRLPKGYDSSKMSATNNYWNTEDNSIINKMVFDKNDDLGAAGNVETLPILIKAHEKTPKVDFSELVVVDSNPSSGDLVVNLDEKIQVKFNGNIMAGDRFNEISLKDNVGRNIKIANTLEGNILNIELESPLKLGINYTLKIPSNSIKDFYGKSLSSDFNVGFTTKDELSTTVIGGIISKDTTLTLKNSPYSLNKELQIAYGINLSIEPGVIIKGNNNNINTWGVLSAIGNEKENILFDNVNLFLKGIYKEKAFMDIQFAKISGGSILSPKGNAVYGSFNLKDSYIKDTRSYMYVWYPTSDVNIERNIFENSGGISVGTSENVKVLIKNNVFYKQTTEFAVQNWASYDLSKTIVENNSFMSCDRVALELPSGYSKAKMTAINNYWNTNDTSVIDNMIFDKKDYVVPASEASTTKDIDIEEVKATGENYIIYEPFLTNKHENTPKFNYDNLILSYLNLKYINGSVAIDKPISVKFNRDIIEGNGFDRVVLRDKNGNIVPVDITLNKNEIQIMPKEYLDYEKEYKIEIAKDSLKDASGNIIEVDYSYGFTTEAPRLDIDNNSIIDVKDLDIVASKNNMRSVDKNWNPMYDFNGDKIIDIYDIVMLSRKIN